MAGEVGVLLLVDVARRARVWGAAQFLRNRSDLPRVPGLTFHKVMGSGHEGGFGLRPSLSSVGLFCAFQDDDCAQAFLEDHALPRAYRDRACEFFTVRLRPCSNRGSWNGSTPFTPWAEVPAAGPVAALTRASIHPMRATAFWRHSPPAEASLRAARGCLMAVGLGEAPLLRQATFSIWASLEAMQAYARSGAHGAAARAAAQEGYFTESMFTRFAPYELRGSWKGCSAAAVEASRPAPWLPIASPSSAPASAA